MHTLYVHHQVRARPLEWKTAAAAIADAEAVVLAAAGGAVFGIWRSQIGRPRDELNVITAWTATQNDPGAMDRLLDSLHCVDRHAGRRMHATLRPRQPTPPRRQGNYAFRSFATPPGNWDEFLQLCAGAWPNFESSYDSQVIGLWRYAGDDGDRPIESLLLTRRPDLAMWERSKLPGNAVEAEVRRKLSRRYDLCTDTCVHTTTLLSATDVDDTARWT